MLSLQSSWLDWTAATHRQNGHVYAPAFYHHVHCNVASERSLRANKFQNASNFMDCPRSLVIKEVKLPEALEGYHKGGYIVLLSQFCIVLELFFTCFR